MKHSVTIHISCDGCPRARQRENDACNAPIEHAIDKLFGNNREKLVCHPGENCVVNIKEIRGEGLNDGKLRIEISH